MREGEKARAGVWGGLVGLSIILQGVLTGTDAVLGPWEGAVLEAAG